MHYQLALSSVFVLCNNSRNFFLWVSCFWWTV